MLINTVIAVYNLHRLVNFIWSSALCGPKLSHGTLLQLDRVYSTPFNVTQNSKKYPPPPTPPLSPIQHQDLAATKGVSGEATDVPEL